MLETTEWLPEIPARAAYPLRQGLFVVLGHAGESLPQLVLLIPAGIEMPSPATSRLQHQEVTRQGCYFR